MVEIDEWHPPSGASQPTGPQSFPRTGINSLAPLGARALARTLDALVLGLPYLMVAAAVVVVAGLAEPTPEQVGNTARTYVILMAPAVVLAVVYETICITLWGQTLGKLVVGIRVARQANGRCPLWWEAALRIAVPGVVVVIPHGLASIVAVSLFSVAAFDGLRRNVPDRAAGTVVVRAR